MTKDFTLLDYLCHGMHIEECRKKGQVATCWMVTNDDVKNRLRKEILDMFNLRLSTLINDVLTEDSFSDIVLKLQPDLQFHVAEWADCELDYAELREAGNPRAFFVRQDSGEVEG